jgi:TIR domain
MYHQAVRKTPSNNDMRVFLCHASGDKSTVRDLYQKLRRDGFQPWLDEEDLLPGADWEAEIRKAVRAADVVLVCLSHRSINKAGFFQKEIRLVLDTADEKPEGAIFLIPGRLENCAVPDRLSKWHWVDLFESSGYTKLRRALNEVRSQLKAPVNMGHDHVRREELVRNVIQVLAPSLGSFTASRPINGLVRAQIMQFHEVEKSLPPEWRTGIDALSIRTEQEAANYIHQMTVRLNPSAGAKSGGR